MYVAVSPTELDLDKPIIKYKKTARSLSKVV